MVNQPRITEWHADDLTERTLAKAAAGMEDAAAFVLQRARSFTKGRIAKALRTKVVTKGLRVTGYLYTGYFVGRLHETGTRKMRSRPHMRPAIYNNGPEITRRIAHGKA